MGEPERSFCLEMTHFLQQVTVSIGVSEDFNTALKTIVQSICEITDWSMGEVWMPSANNCQLVCSPVWYSPTPQRWQAFRDATATLTMKPGVGLAGRVWQCHQPEWLPDMRRVPAPEFLHLKIALAIGVKAGVAVPVLEGDRVLAVLAFYGLEPCPEDPHRVEQMTAIAAHLGPLLRLKQAYEALALGQTQLIDWLDALPGIVFAASADPDWPMQYLSGGCLALTGYRHQELVGDQRAMAYRAITHPEDLPQVLQTITDAIAQGQPYEVEYRIRTLGGAEHWVWEKGYGLYNEDGSVLGIQGLINDTTERRQREEALRTHEARFRSLFYGAAIGICGTAIPGLVGECNPAYERMTGFTTEETRSLPIARATHPDDLAADLHLYQEIFDGKRDSYQIEKRFVCKTGEWLWGRLTAFAVRDPGGSVIFIFAIVEDITERKQTEKAIQDKEAFLRLILDTIPQHIFWKDTHLSYQGANQAFAHSAGLADPSALIGLTDYDLWDPEQAASFRDNDRRVMTTREPMLHVIRSKQLPSGQVLWQNVDKVPIHNSDGDVIGVLGTYEDITEQRRVEEALARRHQYLSVLVEVQNQLLATENLDRVYPEALALLGQVSEADRVYVFENHWDAQGNRLMRHTQEWCAEGIDAQLSNPDLQDLPYSMLPRLEAMLSRGEPYTGIVAAFPSSEREILSSQGIQSILILPLVVNDDFFGFIGFDNCQEAQLWDPLEVDLLRAAAAALALALERQRAIAAVRQSEARYRLLAENSNDVISRHDPESRFLYVSPACLALLGYAPDELLGKPLLAWVHPDDIDPVQQCFQTSFQAESQDLPPYTYRIRHKTGGYLWLETLSRAVHPEQLHEVTEIISVSRDVTERQAAGELLSGQKRVLELIARDRPLSETLMELLRILQSQDPASIGCILLLDADGLHVRPGAVLNLPETYVAALNGQVIGPRAGACGTAMYLGKPVICSDLATDPLWQDYQALVLPLGLRACWSIPILSSRGKVLGSFALYHRTPHHPGSEEWQLVEMACQIAAIAIEQKLAVEALKQAEAKYRGIFENAVEGIFQSTVEGRFITVNLMLATLYGYDSPEQLMATLQDIRHQLYVDPDRRLEFVQAMADQGMVQGFESQVYRRDGSIIWISECARTLRHENGEILGYEGTVENITRRKQADEELINRDNLLQGMAKATHHLLTNTKFEEAIQQALGILGEAADVDRVYIYENHPHPVSGEVAMTIRHEWTQETVPPTLNAPHWHNLPYHQAGLGHWYQRFSTGGAVSGITRQMSAAEQALLTQDQILSIIMVPISVHGSLWGYIGFDECHSERLWTASEESILVAIAASIGGAIQRQHTEAKMRYQAFHDALTGLPNRVFFDHHLDLSLAHSRRSGETFGVMFLDLDRFKTINDTLGHAVGDQLLKLTTQRLLQCLREEDTIARWGGDEFTLLLPNLQSPEDAAKVARRIAHSLKPVFCLEGHDLHITCSMGIAIYPQDGGDADTLLKNADVALYRAKEQGRNNYQFYTTALNLRASERLSLDSSLHRALEKNEFVLYYQPQFNLLTGQVTQMEALIRWQHPKQGLLSPQTFIPLAEENGLIGPIGEWVLQTACDQIRRWQQGGLADLRMAVNLSAHQFQQPNLVERITEILQENQLQAHHLELEITETAFMKDVEFTRTLLHLLRDMGVRIALDDFGTGYSSMYYLREFPLSTLKIDRSFIRDLAHSSQAIAIIDAIITLGRGLQLSVVAEGVETVEQREQLRSLHCQEMQGYLFSPPLDAATATHFLQQFSGR